MNKTNQSIKHKVDITPLPGCQLFINVYRSPGRIQAWDLLLVLSDLSTGARISPPIFPDPLVSSLVEEKGYEADILYISSSSSLNLQCAKPQPSLSFKISQRFSLYKRKKLVFFITIIQQCFTHFEALKFIPSIRLITGFESMQIYEIIYNLILGHEKYIRIDVCQHLTAVDLT